ncbi:hypothetical protein DLAC_09400 [Tieghemostelium lacteum]|uniref:Uncharacterized protein n=1 Tax=Tieghemostelium lacteum TaxID=361077 RepID=A0A151Z9Y4_TIELA|nr:hypothetical protein DLAC_09400 [Tieghemostelium lacteum]|eukprot:KYQ90761.1 hypothetical protein DLAC_09400 [Tieghemostelium lacteum]
MGNSNEDDNFISRYTNCHNNILKRLNQFLSVCFMINKNIRDNVVPKLFIEIHIKMTNRENLKSFLRMCNLINVNYIHLYINDQDTIDLNDMDHLKCLTFKSLHFNIACLGNGLQQWLFDNTKSLKSLSLEYSMKAIHSERDTLPKWSGNERKMSIEELYLTVFN